MEFIAGATVVATVTLLLATLYILKKQRPAEPGIATARIDRTPFPAGVEASTPNLTSILMTSCEAASKVGPELASRAGAIGALDDVIAAPDVETAESIVKLTEQAIASDPFAAAENGCSLDNLILNQIDSKIGQAEEHNPFNDWGEL